MKKDGYISPITQLNVKDVERALLDGLTFAERLLDRYRGSALSGFIEPGDLVSSAYDKSLRGIRHWNPEKCELSQHFAGCIRSEVNNYYHSLTYQLTNHGLTTDDAVAIIESTQFENSPEEKEHFQSSIKLITDFVKNKKPDLLPLAHHIFELDVTKPQELSELLGLPEREIRNQKQALKRLFGKKFIKYYIAHFRDDMSELIELIDAINHKKSRKAALLADFLNMDINEVRRKRDQLDQFIREVSSDM